MQISLLESIAVPLRADTYSYFYRFLRLDIQALQIALLANYIRYCRLVRIRLSFIYHRLYHVLEI